MRRDDAWADLPAATDDVALDQAMLRAYSIERCVDYGCALEDAIKLRRHVEAGHSWSHVAWHLALANEERAAWAVQHGHSGIASRHFLFAAACFRLAQASLEHDVPSRVMAYERQAVNFRAGVERLEYPMVPLALTHQGLPHAAWLAPAPDLQSGGAAVVVWGGADGWCEAFYPSVAFYLERGVSVCLLELPGQGLARWRHGSRLTIEFTALISASLDALIALGAHPARLGVVGHSAGGTLALAAAAADARIRACCSNGGSVTLKQALLNYPRILQRFGRMLGEQAGEKEVVGFLDQLDLPRAASQMQASLLCLHGGQDLLVSDAQARELIELRGASAATLERWPDGVHCLYNHAHERNCVLANWFAAELALPHRQDPLRRSP